MRFELPRRFINRRLGSAFAWIALIVLVAAGVNVVGIHLLGDVESWSRWLEERAAYFFVWRLGLYGATVYGWLWMRRRLRTRDASAATHQRLLHAEIGAVAAVLLLEVSVLWRQP